MKRVIGLVVVAVVLAAGAAGFWWMGRGTGGAGVGSGAGSETRSAVVEEGPVEKVRKVAAGLGSGVERERAAAKEDLAGMSYEWRGALRRVAGEAAGEVKELLGARLAEMDEHFAPEAAGIAVHAEGESLTVILRKMGVAEGKVAVGKQADERRYALEGEGLTFWEAFLALQRQNPSLAVVVGWEFGGVMKLDDHRTRTGVVVKGVQAVFYRYWAEQSYADGRKIAPWIEVVLGIDPRLSVVEVETAAEEGRDASGHVVYVPVVMHEMTVAMRNHTTSNSQMLDMRMSLPESGAERIPVVKVRSRVVYVLASEEAEIEDVEKGTHTVQVGVTKVTVANFRVPGQVFVDVKSEAEGMTPYVIYELYDGKGALVRRWTWAGEQASGTPAGGGGPYRMRVVVPRKVKEVREEFELRDVEAKP